MVAVMASVAPAQIVVPATPARPAPAGTVISANSVELKAGTRLMIQTSDPLSSKSNRAGDHFAIALADPDRDLVLLAGKGHEDYQVRGTQKLPFDEREIVAELMAARAGLVAATGTPANSATTR